jgi:hypothetical protein
MPPTFSTVRRHWRDTKPLDHAVLDHRVRSAIAQTAPPLRTAVLAVMLAS